MPAGTTQPLAVAEKLLSEAPLPLHTSGAALAPSDPLFAKHWVLLQDVGAPDMDDARSAADVLMKSNLACADNHSQGTCLCTTARAAMCWLACCVTSCTLWLLPAVAVPDHASCAHLCLFPHYHLQGTEQPRRTQQHLRRSKLLHPAPAWQQQQQRGCRPCQRGPCCSVPGMQASHTAWRRSG